MKRDASWIASAVNGRLRGADVTVTGSVETDSRRCSAGSLYIARVGETADGHDFVGPALNQGAVCAIVERSLDVDLPQIVVEDATVALGLLAKAHLQELRRLHREAAMGEVGGEPVPCVIGITGSAGKTTTKDLLGQILSIAGPTVYPELSFNNEVGCPLTVLRADESTQFLVLEIGASGPGHIRYLTEIAPLDMAVELMVGKAHLGGFGSVEVLAQSKQELVEGVLPAGVCILNGDDPLVRKMAMAASAPSILFSANGDDAGASRATNVALSADGRPEFTMVFGEESARIQVPLVGEHQVINALAAATAAKVASSMPLGQVATALEGANRLSPHRLDTHDSVTYAEKTGLRVIDDSYNANPDSMAVGLKTARQLAGDGRLVAVLGQMMELGETADSLHETVGLQAAEVAADAAIGVGSGTAPLLESAKRAGVKGIVLCADHEEALRVLPSVVQSGDTIFLKGSFGSEVWRIADALMKDSVGKTTVRRTDQAAKKGDGQ